MLWRGASWRGALSHTITSSNSHLCSAPLYHNITLTGQLFVDPNSVIAQIQPLLVMVISQEDEQFEQAKEEQVRSNVMACTSCSSILLILCTLFRFGGEYSYVSFFNIYCSFRAINQHPDNSDNKVVGGGLVMHISTAILNTKMGVISALV